MRLSDLDKKLWRKNEAQYNKEQGTREVELVKDDVVQALSRENDLSNKKMDELPEKVREELSSFFTEKFWRIKKKEESYG